MIWLDGITDSMDMSLSKLWGLVMDMTERLNRTDLWQPKWNENQPVLAAAIHTPQCSGWELEFRDCGAIPGQGLLLTVERQIKEM